MLKKLLKPIFIIILIIGIYHSYVYMVKVYKFALYQDCHTRLMDSNLDMDIIANICLQKLK